MTAETLEARRLVRDEMQAAFVAAGEVFDMLYPLAWSESMSGDVRASLVSALEAILDARNAMLEAGCFKPVAL